MTAVLEPDAGQRGILQAMLHGSAAFADLAGLDEHIRSTTNEFAVVIGPSVPSEAAADLAQWARVHRPNLGVILLRNDVDSVALSLALRSGMREVVAARDLPGITTAVQRARSVANAIGQTIMDEAQAAAEFARAQAAAEIAEAAAVAQAEADAPRGQDRARSSPPRGAWARASSPPTSASRSPRTVTRSAWSTSTSTVATWRSCCS